MHKIDLTFYAENDPAVIFNLKIRRGGSGRASSGRLATPDDLTGALIECYVKNSLGVPDAQAFLYSSVSGVRHIEIMSAVAGQVRVEFNDSDITDIGKQYYHLDVVRLGRRQTYVYGAIKKIGAA